MDYNLEQKLQEKYNCEEVQNTCLKIATNYSEIYNYIQTNDNEISWQEKWKKDSTVRYLFSLQDQLSYLMKEIEKIKNKKIAQC